MGTSSVALSLIYGDKVSHWTWSSVFCLVWLATCSGDPIPAFVAWPLKVDHCALAFYMGSGVLNFCLYLAWQCFTHWVISQHHLKTLWMLKGELQKKGDVWQSDLQRQGAGGKNHSKKMICDDCIKLYLYVFKKWRKYRSCMFQQRALGLLVSAVRYLDGHGGWVTCRHSHPWQYRLGPPPCW